MKSARRPLAAVAAATLTASVVLAACSAAPVPPRVKGADAATLVAGLASPTAGSPTTGPAGSGKATSTKTTTTSAAGSAASRATTGNTSSSGASGTNRIPLPAALSTTGGPRRTSTATARPGSTKASAGGGTAPSAAATTAAALGYTPLYTGAQDTRGITSNHIQLCAHAALTYGAAFGTKDTDFNVFWQDINAKGGINGRTVDENYVNDNYDPTTAVTAAQTCATQSSPPAPMMILGGIGFDQIPAVREWTETNKELYLYHIATLNGEAGKKYSFSGLPSVEQMGIEFELLAKSRFAGKKIGIIRRDSVNWNPGHDAFLSLAKKDHLNIGPDDGVPDKQYNYTQQALDMKNANVDVVWVWENALNATEIIKQVRQQGIKPVFMVFPFNLTSQTLGADALDPPMVGIAAWPAYSYQDYSGPFAPYADDIKAFEKAYKTYDPNLDLSSVGGDLLYLNWVAQTGIAQLLRDCGKGCTRSSFAHLMEGGYKYTDPKSGCGTDFSRGDHHIGGYQVSVLDTYSSPSGKVNWRPSVLCTTQAH
jgi:ABC-type branched-subunit amino acid transport system substrate-binding protein